MFQWDLLHRTLKKDLPFTAHGILFFFFLPLENEGGFSYDILMQLGLHSPRRTRTGIHNVDVNVHSAREYFIENVAYNRNVFRALPEPPDCLRIPSRLVLTKSTGFGK